MAQTGFSIRMDDALKRDFSVFCESVGMSMSTAFVVFAKAAVREQRFPFEISSIPVGDMVDYRRDRDEVLSLIASMRSKVKASGRKRLSMDEIDAEIANAREERKLRI